MKARIADFRRQAERDRTSPGSRAARQAPRERGRHQVTGHTAWGFLARPTSRPQPWGWAIWYDEGLLLRGAVNTIYDCMRAAGITSYTKDLTPLNGSCVTLWSFPLYDGGNQGVRRQHLHEMFRQPTMTQCSPRGDISP